jgi:hypothetical protein
MHISPIRIDREASRDGSEKELVTKPRKTDCSTETRNGHVGKTVYYEENGHENV